MRRDVTLPVMHKEIAFDDLGYQGWAADVLLNPSGVVYELVLNEDPEKFWEALKVIVLDWNFVDSKGQAIPLPKDWKASTETKVNKAGETIPQTTIEKYVQQLPTVLWNSFIERWFEEFNKTAMVPKGSPKDSENISSINGAGRTSEKA